jgi:hypothetical protein
MPRVLPTQVLAVIDRTFPNIQNNERYDVHSKSANELQAVARLIDEIPIELLPTAGDDYCDLILGQEALREAVTRWQGPRGGDEPPRWINGQSPIFLVRKIIAACPDTRPSPSTAELMFISDADLRESIRIDISTATSSFNNGEWKGATVLAGSAAEALLLWGIQQKLTAYIRSAAKLLANKPRGPIEKWDLANYINVAEQLSIIKTDTATQARLAKDFRNLIHPGRQQRTGQACNKATALSALAAVEHIVEDLTLMAPSQLPLGGP